MRLFIHGLGASAGGGMTYLRNVFPHLAVRPDVQVTLLAGEAARASIPGSGSVQVLEKGPEERGSLGRFYWEQREVPNLIRQSGADVLLSAGNFAIWNPPVPQILLSRNSLYTSDDFSHDLRRRGEYALWADTRIKGMLARKSIQRAEQTLAPSHAFARELRAWTGREVMVLHHGFDRELFFQLGAGLPEPIAEKLAAASDAVRLLFVSHYNYYRNFETLLRALALLKQRQLSKKVRLILTCELSPGKNPGNYRTEGASTLLRELQLEGDVVQLGAIPYSSLHEVYRAGNIYVTPAYAETFAHPLVEAMASGLPIVASDLAVHREITGGGGLFFDRFSPAALAERVAELIESPALQEELRGKGLQQCRNFSWKVHVDQLLALAQTMVRRSA